MYLDIADVRVAVYSLAMPKNSSSLKCFSSFKLENYKYGDVYDVTNNLNSKVNMRTGIVDMAQGYKDHIENPVRNSYIPIYDSSLNVSLTALAFDYA